MPMMNRGSVMGSSRISGRSAIAFSTLNRASAMRWIRVLKANLPKAFSRASALVDAINRSSPSVKPSSAYAWPAVSAALASIRRRSNSKSRMPHPSIKAPTVLMALSVVECSMAIGELYIGG